jgi:5-deoxy-glucuronate isomerase
VVEPYVHPTARPNDLPIDALRIRSGEDGAVSVDPERAGWRYLSFRTVTLQPGWPAAVGTTDTETAVVIVAGGDVRATAAGPAVVIPGRAGPFHALPTAWYLPPGMTGHVEAAESPVLVAVASAPSSGRAAVATAPILVDRSDVRVEVRGAGNATRQINHIIGPTFPADRLEVVEVLTPSGNWSSWPPHKHDLDDMPTEAVLEEIYYYRFRRPEAWGLQRVYRADRSRDGLWEVRTGDVVLVTDGYHPFVAAHGDDAWYLNALAGDRRTMACSFDPVYDWVRGSWATVAPDPRVPLTPDRPVRP